MSLAIELQHTFTSTFQETPHLIIKSPGRINLIGEHTDYNEGFVMPAAIDKGVYIAISKRKDNQIHLHALDYDEHYSTTVDLLTFGDSLWTKYILGATRIVKERESLGGFNLAVAGDLPLGAGLSSSAALTCATTFALNTLFELALTQIDIARIGQRTEHEAVGVRCGIMDQFASVFGKENSFIRLDCRDLSFEYVGADLSDYEILLLNTNVKHSLASSAYNKRRESCERAVALVKEKYEEVHSLRDISLVQLDELVKHVDPEAYQKAKFVVQENQRLFAAVEALQHNNLPSLGELLYQTHWALSKEYEVSCEELDYLVAEVSRIPAVLGARMMGGGFGGCTINIVKKDKSHEVFEQLKDDYFKKFNLELTPISVAISEGTHIVKDFTT